MNKEKRIAEIKAMLGRCIWCKEMTSALEPCCSDSVEVEGNQIHWEILEKEMKELEKELEQEKKEWDKDVAYQRKALARKLKF